MNTLQNPNLADLYQLERNDDRESELAAFTAQTLAANPPEEGAPEVMDIPFVSRWKKREGLKSKVMGAGSELFARAMGPLQAIPAASLAPISRVPGEDESFMEGLMGAFESSGKAAYQAAFPKIGVDGVLDEKQYGTEAVGALFPDLSEGNKQALGMVAELAADPSLALGLPAIKVVNRGMQIASQSAKLKGETNILSEAVMELLTFGKQIDPAEAAAVADLAKMSGQGSKKAFQEMDKLFRNDPKYAQAALAMEDSQVVEGVAKVGKVIGNVKDPIFKPVKVPNPRDVKGTLSSNKQSKALNVNLSRLNTTEDVDEFIVKASKYYEKDYLKAAGKQSHSQTATKAQNEMLTDLLGRKTTEFAPEQAYGLRQSLVSSANQLQALAIKASGPTASSIDTVAFQKAMTVHKAIQEKATGVAANAGRLLNQFNIVAEPSAQQLRQINDIAKNVGLEGDAMQMIAKLGDPAKISKFVEKSSRVRAFDNALHELFINVVLSGPITHAVNGASNVFTLTMAPTEEFLKGMSAAARGDFKQSKLNFGTSWAKLAGTVEGMKDASILWKEVGGIKAIANPEKLRTTHEVGKQFRTPSISSDRLNASGALGASIDFMGKYIRMPGNALGLEDAMFKSIHRRVEINAEAYRQASKFSDPTDMKKAYTALRKNPDENSTVGQQAQAMADYYTFTNEMGNNGKLFAHLMSQPGIRYVVPFFRTPTNIVKMGVEYSPLGVGSDIIKAFKSGEGAVKDAAAAKMAMGTLIPAAIMSGLGDHITGSIDQKTPAGQFEAQHGRPPYSIQFGDKWVSYEKIEPVRSVLGLLVNMRDALKNVEAIDPITGQENDIVKEYSSAVIGSFMSTVTENYMLQEFGKINYLLEGLNSGDMEGAQDAFADLAASMTVPNFVNQINQTLIDGKYRETEGYLQKVQSKIPMLSRSLPPKLTIWGDERHVPDGLGPDIISPFKTRAVKSDEIDNELIRLGVNPPKVADSMTIAPNTPELELTPLQVHKIEFLRGKGPNGKTPLKDIIGPMTKANMPDEFKKEQIQKVMNQMTMNAKQMLYASDPELQAQFKGKMLSREQVLRGYQQ